jgi:very-short-patch-repair endonuclease
MSHWIYSFIFILEINNYDKLDIRRAPSINYKFNDKIKVYHPDFYIPSLNLIVEIKSSYFYKKYEEKIKSKEKGVISNGFNYIIIL